MAIELSGKWIVELEPGVYFDACCAGDPPRTVVRKFARQYKTESGALRGLRWCQRFRPFMNGKVVRVDDTATQARRAAFNKLVPPTSGVECCDIVEHFNFCVGNAIKYLWRAGLKGDAIEDLRKAAWYVQREIDRREKEAGR